MGTYFHGNSEIQGDGLQTLILMNPGYNVGYSDTAQQHQHQHQQPQPPPGNYMFLNSSNGGNSINPTNLSHAPPTQATQQFVGIPLSAAPSAAPQQDHRHHPSVVHSQHDISALHGFMPRLQYSLYNPVDLTAARDITRSQQSLSLSLSSQQPGYGTFGTERELLSPAAAPAPAPTISPRSGDDIRIPGGSPSSASGVSNGVNGMQSVLLSSKYLKAAQELLDEVVNVGKGVKNGELATLSNGNTKNTGESPVAAGGDGISGGGETSSKRSVELTTAERQEIQMKKAKLVNMLDEVEQRYRQYHNQMHIVISWFEQAAGIGSAKTYTALALQTISKQFRCLKDAILGQIRAASKSLGEEDCLGGGKMEGSRLKFVDNQLRQQRALQQLGMIQHNAWRPQRGLPERSVSVLRAWLFALQKVLGFIIFFSSSAAHATGLTGFEEEMATAAQLTASSLSARSLLFPSFDGGLKPSAVKVSSVSHFRQVGGLSLKSFRGLTVKAATVVAPKYTTLKPLGDRVLVKIKTVEEKTTGGILLPTTAQSKPQGGEVVAVGEGRTVGPNKVDVSVKTGTQVVYSKYAGTEVEFNGSNHLILKEDDIIGILDTDDVKDLKPLNDRVFIKVAEAEEKTSGGLLLTEASKEKPSIGTVIAVGPGPLDEEGKRESLSISPGNSVMYSKYAGNDFKGTDGSDYITLRASDVMAVLS